MKNLRPSFRRTERHTPEPWLKGPNNTAHNGYAIILKVYDKSDDPQISAEQAEADLERAIGAVNACVGVPSEALRPNLVQDLAAAVAELTELTKGAPASRHLTRAIGKAHALLEGLGPIAAPPTRRQAFLKAVNS